MNRLAVWLPLGGTLLAAMVAWAALGLPRPAFVSEVQAVDAKVDNSKVCILRLENRRLEIELETATSPNYRAYLNDQIAANTRKLEELAKKGAHCAG